MTEPDVASSDATQTKGASTLEVLAVVDPSRGHIALRRLAGAVPRGRVLELSAILPDQAPISLGVLPDGDVTRVSLPAGLVPQIAQVTLAISKEPSGGAPDGAPTGGILSTGVVAALQAGFARAWRKQSKHLQLDQNKHASLETLFNGVRVFGCKRNKAATAALIYHGHDPCC